MERAGMASVGAMADVSEDFEAGDSHRSALTITLAHCIYKLDHLLRTT